LRFLACVPQRGIAEVERGRGAWSPHESNSLAILRAAPLKPVIRPASVRLLTDDDCPERTSSGLVNRQNNPEIDLVGADRAQPAATTSHSPAPQMAGDGAFGKREGKALADPCRSPAYYTTPLVAVSRTESRRARNRHVIRPEEMIAAWRPLSTQSGGT